MSRLSLLRSSVVTKALIAVTGLGLFAYLVLHLAGNLLIFAGAETFNGYAHAMITNPLVVPVELGLLAIFLLHVYKAVTMTGANRAARPEGYRQKARAGHTSRKSLASTTMIWSGVVLAVFVVQHVWTFKYGPYYEGADAGVRDLYRLVLENFRQPLIVGFYVACMGLVGLHLWHGVSSAFQSLGVDHPRLTPRILLAGRILAVVIGGGFALIPLWMFFLGGRS